jgi:hypothetical protein
VFGSRYKQTIGQPPVIAGRSRSMRLRPFAHLWEIGAPVFCPAEAQREVAPEFVADSEGHPSGGIGDNRWRAG